MSYESNKLPQLLASVCHCSNLYLPTESNNLRANPQTPPAVFLSCLLIKPHMIYYLPYISVPMMKYNDKHLNAIDVAPFLVDSFKGIGQK